MIPSGVAIHVQTAHTHAEIAQEEKSLLAASSDVLEHILDQMSELTYTIEQARMDLGIH